MNKTTKDSFVTEDSFQIKFYGPATKYGTLEAREFGKYLVALDEMFNAAIKEQYGSKAEISLKVSKINKGSFEVLIALGVPPEVLASLIDFFTSKKTVAIRVVVKTISHVLNSIKNGVDLYDRFKKNDKSLNLAKNSKFMEPVKEIVSSLNMDKIRKIKFEYTCKKKGTRRPLSLR